MSEDIYFFDKFNVTSARYAILFSYENVYGLFRPKETVKYHLNSSDYELISFDTHNSNFEGDVLTDLCFLVSANKLNIRINDVICIRSNGRLFSYLYIKKLKGISDYSDCFMKIKDFFKDEIYGYLDRIHNESRVLSVLDGKILSISDPNLRKSRVYCIERETFDHKTSCLTSNYSMFGLFDKDIRNINPGGLPFVSLKNAIYYYNKNRKKGQSGLLLFNRRELEMIKDYGQLNNVAFTI